MSRHSGRSTPGDGWAAPEDSPLDRFRGDLARNDLARHLAFFFEEPVTRLEVAATFVKHGLETGKRCLYFHNTNTRADVEGMLEAAGVDVAAREAAGDLLIESGADTYRQAGFEPEALIADLEDETEASLTAGYEGFWITGETTWCFHTASAYDHIVDFEAAFDTACQEMSLTALCQYDLRRFSGESVAKALWTHEQVVYRNRICENPLYVAPAEYRSEHSELLDAHLMLEQIHRLERTKENVQRHEQRLSVVNRVLRHNIRNDLNVALGRTDHLRDSVSLDREQREALSTAVSHLEDVLEIADKARYVEETIERSETERAPVGTFLERARARVDERCPSAGFTVDGDDELTVMAASNLDVALAELSLYTVRGRDGEPPELSVTVSAPSAEVVQLDLHSGGGPIPDSDRLAVENGLETQLQHAQGLGLWLAKWIVENSHGRLHIPERGEPDFRIELVRQLD